MRRLIRIFLTVGVLGLLCSIAACKKDVLPQPKFPLEAAAITATLEKAGLQGEISESETTFNDEGYTRYVVRSPTEAYSDRISLEEAQDNPSSRVIIAGASSAIIESERTLYTTFDQIDISDQFAWEDWKQQIVFATLLYGGFEDEEEVYRAFLGKALPECEDSEGEISADWDAQLLGGYCWMRYMPRKSKTFEGEYDIPTWRHSGTLFVKIYESKTLFQKHQQEAIKRKEAL